MSKNPSHSKDFKENIDPNVPNKKVHTNKLTPIETSANQAANSEISRGSSDSESTVISQPNSNNSEILPPVPPKRNKI